MMDRPLNKSGKHVMIFMHSKVDVVAGIPKLGGGNSNIFYFHP